MDVKSFGNGTALIELTMAEITTINNALNEICNGIHLEGEFDTRIGCTVEDAKNLLADINRLANSQEDTKHPRR